MPCMPGMLGAGLAAVLLVVPPAHGLIEAPYSLGDIAEQSTVVVLVRVESDLMALVARGIARLEAESPDGRAPARTRDD